MGEYRIVYEWDDEIICVPVIDKRNDGEAYKKLRHRKSYRWGAPDRPGEF
jgi:hypothetical protein